MTITQLEQRVSFLEKKIETLETQLNRTVAVVSATDSRDLYPGEDEIIPGTEYPVVLSKPPTKEIRLRGIIREILPARQDLGLSDAEIALFSEDQDE